MRKGISTSSVPELAKGACEQAESIQTVNKGEKAVSLSYQEQKMKESKEVILRVSDVITALSQEFKENNARDFRFV